MSEATMPVTGPHRVSIRSIPAGVEIDVSAYVESVLRHLAKERPEDLVELIEVAASADFHASYGSSDAPAVHERDALVQDLVAAVPHLEVYGAQAVRLGERISASAGVALGGAA